MIDVARITKEEGLYNLFISNGFINKKPLFELCKVAPSCQHFFHFHDRLLSADILVCHVKAQNYSGRIS
jgi:hypothetical protein